MRNAAVLRDQLVAPARGERPLLEAIAAYEEDMRAATYPLMELAADHEPVRGRRAARGPRRRMRRGAGMRVLGLSAGNPDGSAEILLEARARRRPRPRGREVGARPTRTTCRCRRGRSAPGEAAAADDGPWLWDQLMESATG